ncbi:MAG: amidohydrolase [Bacteroidetes bacterium]|nr:MAG: amidohydrolase [Bacteroidota bacterium]
MLKEKIKKLAEEWHEDTILIRRHLHKHPELSFEEKETSAFIAQKLSEFGIAFENNIAGYGIVGLIKGKNPDKKITALRADIDALPIKEANSVDYCSVNEGIMHACGHDVHTASLLGAARILNELRDEFEGSIKLLFQPAEEKLPGGASLMIKESALENPSPETILGQHVHPPLEVGKIGIRSGIYMASADEIYITVKGKGGHGALPNDCIDPVVITAHIITALQMVVSRNANPNMPTVLTFGHIESEGGSTNVIPNEVHLKGTLRTFDEEWRFEAHKKIESLISNIAEGMGGSYRLDIKVGYPCLVNEPELTGKVKSRAIDYLGEENVVELPIRTTAEDFSFYSQVMPACFYRLGTGNKAKGITSPVHTNTFDVDEDCLKVSTGLMAWLALSQLAVSE